MRTDFLWKVSGDVVANDLRKGVVNCECGIRLSGMDSLHRCDLYTKLVMERLARKCNDVKTVFAASDGNWNQTMYVMLFKAMGGNSNRKPFMKLADKVNYNMCLRERGSLFSVEALLLGASGLIFGEYYDDYLQRLVSEYDYLRNKYQIGAAMYPGEWETWRINPANNPVLRIAQIAALVYNNDFIFDNMLNCTTRNAIHDLFKAEASDYWATHYSLSGRSTPIPKRLGAVKRDLLGINVVVPLMFSYANYISDEALKMRAVELLEDIPAENNMIIRRWVEQGCMVANAFDTQALLQLNNEYCEKGRCEDCLIGKKVINME